MIDCNDLSLISLQRFSELLQVVFILFLSVYLFECVDYDTLFSSKITKKVTLSDVLDKPGQCMTKFSFGVSKVLTLFY